MQICNFVNPIWTGVFSRQSWTGERGGANFSPPPPWYLSPEASEGLVLNSSLRCNQSFEDIKFLRLFLGNIKKNDKCTYLPL